MTRSSLRRVLPLAGAAAAGLLLLPRGPAVDPDRQPVPRETSSEAMEALDWWAAPRAYPGSAIPDAGHALAFSYSRTLRTLGENGPSGTAVDDLTDPWSSLGPTNIGGRTLSLAVLPGTPDTLFAGSASGGLWKSTTGGGGADAWDYVDTGFPVLSVSAIAVDPADHAVMYIGTGEVYRYQNSIGGDVDRTTRGSYGIGILKSTDGGATWSKSLDWTTEQSRGVWSIRIHPKDPDIVYTATTEGVYKSVDAGGSWTRVHSVIMATDIAIHPTAPETVFAACGDFGSAGNGIYRSYDGGGTWTRLTNGLPASWTGKAMLAIAPSGPHIVYASIANTAAGFGLYKSLNGGDSWSRVNTTDYPTYQGWYSHWVLVSPTNVNRLFVGGIDVWRSTDGGITLTKVSDWTQAYLGTPPPEGPGGGPLWAHADQHFAVWHPTAGNVVYFVSDGGVFKTTDGGDSFEGLNGGYVTSQFYQGFTCSATDSLLAMGGIQDNFTAIYAGSSGATAAGRRSTPSTTASSTARPRNSMSTARRTGAPAGRRSSSPSREGTAHPSSPPSFSPPRIPPACTPRAPACTAATTGARDGRPPTGTPLWTGIPSTPWPSPPPIPTSSSPPPRPGPPGARCSGA
jgi:photosystem II stability/assembly factor-like uncharacterized protein